MKIAVAGCSVSDYTEVDKVYGELLAERIGAEYIHEGAGCGSNYRIWRRITGHVMNGTITPEDIVIIQYTEVTRDEFWSSYVPSSKKDRYDGKGKIELRENFDTGDIIRWKTLQYGRNATEYNFLKLKEEHFTSIKFCEEKFATNHYAFHNMLINKGIKVVYFSPAGAMHGYGQRQIDYYNKNDEIIISPYINKGSAKLLPDNCHFSQYGHICMAEKLEKELRSRGLI